MSAPSVLDRIPLRSARLSEPVVRLAVRPGDVPLVEPGDRVAPGDPLLRRARHPQVGEQALHGMTAPQPGTRFGEGMTLAGGGRHPLRFDGAGEVLYATPGGRLRAVISRHHAIVESPVAGTVVSLDACALDIRVDGVAIEGAMVVGEPSFGPLIIAVDSAEAELHAQGIDVRHAGAVLVAGSRVDVESLTRARAMGVRGVIAGGVIGGDVLALRASIDRQEASVHASPAFALVVLDGYGKRPIPRDSWDALNLSAGETVGLTVTPPLVVLPRGATHAESEPDRVRVAAGPLLGRTGRAVELAGMRRQAAGVYQECVRVALDPLVSPGPPDLVDVPIADLERDG